MNFGAKFVTFNRESSAELRRVLADGADALIDVTAYSAVEGHQLLDVQGSIGALVVLSSSSVYRDSEGRTLDEATRNGFPALPVPITEAQPTVAPGDETYSTRKNCLGTSVARQGQHPRHNFAASGNPWPGLDSSPFEWWFVKRIQDGRPAIPLAYKGKSRFHTSGTHANVRN
jgi:hypothetical protein